MQPLCRLVGTALVLSALPCQGGNAQEIPRTVTYSIESYCENLSQKVGGSYQVKAACIQSEGQAQRDVAGLGSTEKRIADFCGQVSGAAGGSYQVYFYCVLNEEKAKSGTATAVASDSHQIARSNPASPARADTVSSSTTNIPAAMPTWKLDSAAFVMANGWLYALRLDAVRPIRGKVRASIPQLQILCSTKDHRPDFQIVTGQVLEAEPDRYSPDYRIAVLWRLDDEKAKTQYWYTVKDLETLIPSRNFEEKRINHLTRATRRQVGFDLYSGRSAVAEFSVAGLEAYLATLARRCGWKR